MKTRLTLFALTAFLLAFTVNAKAELISEWNYSVNSHYTAWTDLAGKTGTYDPKTGSTNSNTKSIDFTNDRNTMRWGTSSGRSSLTMQQMFGTLNTDDLIAKNLLKLTHDNKPINTSVNEPVKLTISMDVILSSLGNEYTKNASIDMNLLFIETPNNSSVRNAFGTDGDLFVLVGDPVALTQKFTIGDYEYDFTLQSAFNLLEDKNGLKLDSMARNYLGGYFEENGIAADTPLYGWMTNENTSLNNDFYVTIQVRHEHIGETPTATTPEPASMLILGVGLCGLPLCRRLRRKTA